MRCWRQIALDMPYVGIANLDIISVEFDPLHYEFSSGNCLSDNLEEK